MVEFQMTKDNNIPDKTGRRNTNALKSIKAPAVCAMVDAEYLFMLKMRKSLR